MNLEIITYWNVETLYYVLNGVASIMQSGHFASMTKFVFLFALMVGIFSYGAAGKTLELATWFLQALLLTTLLNLPITNVLITDKTGQESPRVVGNVPLSLAVIAQASTMVFGRLTDFYETTFSIPGELGLAQGDVGFGHRILKQVNQVSLRDPGLRSDLMQFIKECTLYDLKDGTIASSDLIGTAASSAASASPWTVMFSNTSPARFSTYNTLPGTASTPTVTAPCPDVAAVLSVRVGSGIAASQAFYGRTLFPRTQTDAVAQGLFVNAVGTSYDWILNNSQNASDAMRQAMFNNLWKDAGTELPALLGDASRVAEVNALMGSAQAAAQGNAANSVLAQLAQENLPHMRNWIEAILYSLFPVVLLLAVFLSAQGAWKLLGGYAMALVWIGLWPLLFAIINGLSLLHLKHKTAALNLATNVPFQLSDVFDATLGDEQAAIGYMVVLVPFIAGAIVKMGQGSIMSMADRMSASFSSAGASAAANAASGNFSSGQVGMDSAHVNTTAMHKYDSNIGLVGGGAALSMGRGGSLMMQGARAARVDMLNRFASTLSLGSQASSGSSQEAGTHLSAGTGHSVSTQSSDAATLSDLRRKGASRSQVQSIDQAGAWAKSGGEQGSAADTVRRHKEYSDSFTFGSAIGATTALRVGARVGAGTQTGLGGGGPGSGSAAGETGTGRAPLSIDPDEKRLLDTMEKQGATPEKKTAALQKLRDSKAPSASPSGTGSGSGISAPQRATTAGLNVGLDSTQTASASQGTAKSASSGIATSSDASRGTYYSEGGTVTNTQSRGKHATQDQGLSRESTKTHVEGYSSTSEATLRQDSSTGERSSRNISDSIERHRDLLADTGFMAQVAQRNHMSEARFYNQDDIDVLRMVENYAAERGMFQQASSMPQQSLSGSTLSTTPESIRDQAANDAQGISNQTAITAVANNRAVGVSSSVGARIPVTVALPLAMATDAKSKVGREDESARTESAPFVKNVQVWTNEGQELGTGPVVTSSVVDKAVSNSVLTTVGNAKRALTGSPPEFNDKPLSDAEQKQKAPTVTPTKN